MRGKEWIEPSQFKAVSDFLKWAKTDIHTPIVINGWADKTGTDEQNKKISFLRASSVRNYLVKKGVSTSRITFQGCGVDANAESNTKARRADLFGAIVLTKHPVTVQTEVQEPPIRQEWKEQKNKAVESQIQITETEVTEERSTVEQTTTNNSNHKKKSLWYVGISGGVSFGRSTFCSFAMDGTRPGFNVGVLGGYEINHYLSAELSLDYTRMTLGTYDCCQNLWLASDGNRHFAPLAGVKNYQYNDLRSTTNLVGLGAHLNFDLVGIWKENSRWSALVMPAVYGVVSTADVKLLSANEKVRNESAFHFGVGTDLGVGYMVTPCFGLRLKTGISLLTGKPMDAMPKAEHKSNYVWNTSLQVIFKL